MSGIKGTSIVSGRIDNERLILEARSETIESGPPTTSHGTRNQWKVNENTFQ